MFTFNGRLSRNDYWLKLLLAAAWATPISLLLLYILDLQDAEATTVSTGSRLVVMAASISLALIVLAVVLTVLSITVRRSRDIGNVVVWAIIGLGLPFGWLLIGLLPSKPQA